MKGLIPDITNLRESLMIRGPLHDESLLQTLEAELAAARHELNDHRRIHRTQMHLAARVHRSLLPHPVRHPRIDIETRYVPVDGVGGDYCQIVFLDDACYVTICDVAGHGIGPALLATRVSSEVRRLALDRRRPRDIVQRVNEFVLESFCDTDLYLSFFAARLDLQRRALVYSGAGHPGPLLIRRGGGPVEVLQSQNVLLGVSAQCLCDEPEHTRMLDPGDRLILYTDGLTETANAEGELLGGARLGELARLRAGDVLSLADSVMEVVEGFRAGPVRDDMTLIVAEMK